MVRVGLLLLALPGLLLGCGAQAEEPLTYAVAWRMSAEEYDDAAAEAALEACDEVDGADLVAAALSLPPVPQWEFRGDAASQRQFEDCLLGLDDAVIYGPATAGMARSPVLHR